MESRATLFGHPIHQMLIVFPLGLLATAVIFDAVYLVGDALLFADFAALSLLTAWLGGELVDRLGVGVHAGAGLDAPQSSARATNRARNAPRA